MLVLSRRIGERIVIDGQITVTVIKVRGGQIRLGIEAPQEIGVRREEVAAHPKEMATAQGGCRRSCSFFRSCCIIRSSNIRHCNHRGPVVLKTGILNPHINALLSRVRHTNTLVIADRGFPFWPTIETVDISLVDGIPTVLDVLRAIRANFVVGKAWMAEEFLKHNEDDVRLAFAQGLSGIPLIYEPHLAFKSRIPLAIGLIRTGDTVQYANMLLESA